MFWRKQKQLPPYAIQFNFGVFGNGGDYGYFKDFVVKGETYDLHDAINADGIPLMHSQLGNDPPFSNFKCSRKDARLAGDIVIVSARYERESK
jgi:hypothetical protein